MSAREADAAFRAAIGAMSAPLVSPIGTCVYDFDCMMGQVHKSWNLAGRVPFETHVNLHVYSVAYLLHTCTAFGYFLAIQRFHRARALQHGFAVADKDATRRLAFDQSGRRRALLAIADAIADVNEADPLVGDGEPVHFRGTWFRHFVASAYLLDRTRLQSLGVDDFRLYRALAEAMLISDAFDIREGKRCFGAASDKQPLDLHTEALRKGIPLVRYNGVREKVPLDTRALMEAYVGIAELLLRLEGLVEPATPLVREFLQHRAYAVVRLGLYCLGVETVPYNMLVFAPELLLLMEKALNPPIPPIYDPSSTQVGAAEIDPIVRFAQLAQLAANNGRPLRLLGLDANQFRRRVLELRAASALPEFDVWSLARSRRQQAVSPPLTTLDWYEKLQSVSVDGVYRDGTTTLSEYLCCSVLSKTPDPARFAMTIAPFLLDEQLRINAGPVLHNQEDLILFTQEHVRCFALGDLLLSDETVRPLPFGVSSATLCDDWKIMRTGQFENFIDGKLGLQRR